ncbi:hypothetical protein [Actinocorallia libanotica]|uniref:hypothetical protein n=1 Tax=Actinocorallia libanotica TaxID=46162 RepID=UPI0031DC67C8
MTSECPIRVILRVAAEEAADDCYMSSSQLPRVSTSAASASASSSAISSSAGSMP